MSDARRLNMSQRTLDILQAIPPDPKWVVAKEIEAETGYSSNVVGAVIGYNLLYKYVRRRPTQRGGDKCFEYQRATPSLL